jgi:hypothetical protein
MMKRRALLLAAGLLLAWTIVVVATGGVTVELPWGRLSSHAAVRPLIAAGVLLLLYAAFWRQHWRTDAGRFAGSATSERTGHAAITVALVTGLGLGTWIAGGPDASGYVSQASMFARGTLTQPVPDWAMKGKWHNAAWSTAPVGYRPSVRDGELAPTYPPGLSLLMALLMIAVGPAAVFVVVPLTGAAAAWATYQFAARLHSPPAGAVASALLVVSPPFLDMVTQPMSDVPATAFWALALLAASTNRPVAAGLAASMATLIRPNLAPLAVFPAGLLLLDRSPEGGRPERLRRVMVFVAALAPAVLVIAGLNTYYFGSSLRSGYGALDELFGQAHIVPNLARYGWWFITAQTPFALVGLAAPYLARGTRVERVRVTLIALAWPIAVLALYLPYLSFDEWFYLRFLLPGYVGLFTGIGILVAQWGAPARIAAGAMACYCLAFAIERGALNNYFEHRRFARAVEHVHALPVDAVALSNAYSGTLRYYTGRDILRFEVLEAATVDRAIDHVRGQGRAVYFVGDVFEVRQATERFRGTRTHDEMMRAVPVHLGEAVAFPVIATSSGTR